MTDLEDRKTVLLFSPFFFPENIGTGRYNTHLALALQQRGNEVVTVCSYPFYPEWEVSTGNIDGLPGIEILRGGSGVEYPGSQVLRRLILELWYFFFTRKAIRSLSDRKIDLIIDIFPPNLFSLGSLRKRRLKAPIVGIVHDLQGVMSQTRASFLRRIVGKLILPIEKAALARCDRLMFLSFGMMQFALDEYGLDKGKCDVAYPFQSLSGHGDVKIPPALLAHEKSLVYSGALSEKQAPEELLQLMDDFSQRHPDYGVVVFSNGPVFESLKERFENSGSRVEFHGLVPDDELEGLLRRSTIQIIPQKLSVSHGAFPSKLPNLIATGTRIFAVTDDGSEVDHILSRYSRGKAVNSWEPSSAIRALEDFADEVGSGAEASGAEVGDKELSELFCINRLCDKVWMNAEDT
jgi:glycosyltransferase involved in cell wall biosynthesis